MASYHGAPRHTTRRRQPTTRPMSLGEWLMALVVFGALGVIIYWQVWPKITTVSAPTAQQAAPTMSAQPTMSAPARQEAQQAAPDTAAENLPVATPQAGQYPAAPQEAQPASYSPQDLGNAPLPTPTSGLTQAQQDAAAEASEMADLANAQAGLTPAQLETKVHDACWNAGGCGKVAK